MGDNTKKKPNYFQTLNDNEKMVVSSVARFRRKNNKEKAMDIAEVYAMRYSRKTNRNEFSGVFKNKGIK